MNTIYKNGNNLKRKIKKESRKQKKGECFMITIKTAKKQKLKESKGITLIALVITIIVLLILAGVTIATLTGDNGVLTKAESAKTETENASAEEKVSSEAVLETAHFAFFYILIFLICIIGVM